MAQESNSVELNEGNSFQYDEFILNLLITEPDSPLLITEKALLESSIVSKINTYLNKAETRIEGLNIITNILSKCSKDILTKYGLLWISKTTQVLENIHTNDDELTLACQVLGNLLKLCKRIPEVQKEISLHNVKQLVSVITQLDLNEKGSSILYPLVILLYYYKEPTEKFQTSINDFILRCIDSEDEYLIQASANCFSVLNRAIEKSFKVPSSHSSYNCWTYSEKLLCNSLHCIMNSLFSNLMDFDEEDIEDSLKLSDLPEDNIFEFYFSLGRRFKNLSIYLSTMLRGCGGKNSVVSEDILRLLCRGLAITPIVLRENDLLKNQLLVIIIPKLHIQLFYILNGLIEGFSCHLIPVAKEILNLYVQSLKWINDYSEKHKTINGSKPFVNLKVSVYKSLSLWLNTLGRKSGIEMISQQIFPIIFKDITPEKYQVSLTVKSNNSAKKNSKKAQNTYFGNDSTTSDDEKIINNTDLCQNALCVFRDMFYNTGLLISPSFYEKSHKIIVSQLYDVYLKSEEMNPYKANTECRLNLIRALKGVIMNPHPQVPTPSTYAVQLFNFAMNDEENCIREEAKIGLAELEKIVHPSAPTLDLSSKNHTSLSFDNDNTVNGECNSEFSENMTITSNNDE